MAYKFIKEEIERLSQEEGLKDDEIAIKIGCARATVNRIRLENDIPKANLENRKDKSYICAGCGKEIFIRRKDRRQCYCPECKEKIAKNLPLPNATINQSELQNL